MINITEISWPEGFKKGERAQEILRQLCKGYIQQKNVSNQDWIEGLVDGFMMGMMSADKSFKNLTSDEFNLLAAEIYKWLLELVEMLQGEEGHK